MKEKLIKLIYDCLPDSSNDVEDDYRDLYKAIDIMFLEDGKIVIHMEDGTKLIVEVK